LRVFLVGEGPLHRRADGLSCRSVCLSCEVGRASQRSTRRPVGAVAGGLCGFFITESSRINFVLFGMQNRTFGPCLAAIDWVMLGTDQLWALSVHGCAHGLGRERVCLSSGGTADQARPASGGAANGSMRPRECSSAWGFCPSSSGQRPGTPSNTVELVCACGVLCLSSRLLRAHIGGGGLSLLGCSVRVHRDVHVPYYTFFGGACPSCCIGIKAIKTNVLLLPNFTEMYRI
jgi:hypothetical protein